MKKNAKSAVQIIDDGRSERLAQCKLICEAREKQIMDSLDVVHEINCYSVARSGFGWRKSDGKLVEYSIPREDGLADIYDPADVDEITLRDSLKWVEHMEYSAARLDADCVQTGPGYERWILELHAALKPSPPAAHNNCN